MKLVENPLVIEDREELIFVLSEASQLEHMLMCEYLFAAFSLKRDIGEGLTPEQLQAVNRWERAVVKVATQEMFHLAQVSNLLTAVGGIPYFNRPNFPQRSKYYPPHVQLALLPFGEQALQHFLFLERPEGMDLEDAPGFDVLAESEALADVDEVVPEAQDFATVGHLYRSIERGFAHLVDKYGERQVFVGPPRAQASGRRFGWPELVPTTDLASAMAAIETIVEQGEGARGDWKNAHYGKFLEVLTEYREFKRQDPAFEPAQPCVPACVRPEPDMSDISRVTDPLTAHVSNLFNASYEVMLQMLIRYFIHTEETDEQLKTLSGTAVDMMFTVIEPLGRLLTRLPLGPDHPGIHAGPSFEMFRTGYVLPHRYAAWVILRERLLELASYGERIAKEHASAPTDLPDVVANLRHLSSKLERHIDETEHPAVES